MPIDFNQFQSEDELVTYLGELGERDGIDFNQFKSEDELVGFLQTYEPQTPTTAPEAIDENSFTKGLSSGWRQTKGLLGDALPGLVNSILGDEEGAQRQFQEYQAEIALDAELNPREVESYRDIEFGKNTMDYVSRALGEGLVSFLPSLVTGGIGSVLGKEGLKYVAKKGAKKYTDEAMEKLVKDASKKGLTGGVIAGGMSQNAPETWVNLKAEGVDSPTTALVAGSIKTALDSFPQLDLLSRVLPGGSKVTDAISDKLLSRVIGQTIRSGWQEGLTEAAQEGVDIAAENFLIENKEFFNTENMDRMIDAGLQGMIAGGFMGGLGGINDPNQTTLTNDEAKKKLAEAEEEIPEGTKEYEEALASVEEEVSPLEEDLELAKEVVNTPEQVIPEESAFTNIPSEPLSTDDVRQTALKKEPTTETEVDELEAAERFQMEEESRFQEAETVADSFFEPQAIETAKTQNLKSREKLIYMNPVDFLTMAEEGVEDTKTKGVTKLIEEGTKFESIPYLSFNHDGKGEAKVISHEGRHRARALLDKGVTSMPVRLESSEHGDGKSIRWGSQEEGNFDKLSKGTYPTTLKGQDGQTSINFPIKETKAIQEQVINPKITPHIRTVKMSPVAKEKMAKVTQRLEGTIRKVAGKDVQIEFVDSITALSKGKETPLRGVQTGSLIQVAMEFDGVKDMDETSFHEAWHYLREETGVFSKGEQKILDNSQPQMKAMIAEEYGLDMRDIDAIGDAREIEATAAGIYMSKKANKKPVKSTGLLNRVFDKVVNLLKGIANSFRQEGIGSFEDIFDNVAEGQKASDAFNRANNEVRLARTQEVYKRAEERRLTEQVLESSPVPVIKNATEAEQETGNITGLASYMTWNWSMPKLAQKNPLIAKVVNLFVARQEEQSRIQKIFEDELRNVMGTDQVIGKSEQRKTYITAMNATNHLETTEQDIKVIDGRVVYRNKKNKLVRLPENVSKTIVATQQIFKDIARLSEKSERENLTDLGMDTNASYEEIDTHVGELMKQKKDLVKDAGEETPESTLLKEQIEALQAIKKSINTAQNLINSNRPYLPHMWFGKNVIWVYDKEKMAELPPERQREALVNMSTVEDDLSGRPDKKQWTTKTSEIKGKYSDTSKYKIVGIGKPRRLQANDISKNIPDAMLTADLISSLIGTETGPLHDAVMKRLETQIGARGLGKLLRERRGVEGYSTDWERVTQSYFSSIPRTITNLKYSSTINKLRGDVPTWNINDKTRKEITDYIDYVSSPEHDMIGMRMFNFTMALGFNISSAMMQFATNPTATMSLMSQWNGNILSNGGQVAKGIKDGMHFEALLRKHDQNIHGALRDALKSGFINESEGQLLRKAWDNGKLEAALTGDQLGGTAYERAGLSSNVWRAGAKLGTAAATPITMAEQATRIGSLLSLYRSQPKESHTDSAFDLMKNDERFKNGWEINTQFNPREFVSIYGVDEAHAIFGKAGRGKNQRGIWGSLIFPFMTHPMQIMELILKQATGRGARGRRAALVHISSLILLAGMYGIPAMELWEELIEAYYRMFKGTEVDIEKEIRQYLVEEAGMSPEWALTVTQGVPRSMLDIDIARRIGIPYWGQNGALQAIKGLTGGKMDSIDRFAGVAGSTAAGIGKIATQEMTTMEKATQFMPVAFKNMYEGAVGYSERGAKNWKGKTLVTPEDLTTTDKLAKAFGLNPGIVAEAREISLQRGLESRRGRLGLDKAKEKLAKLQVRLIRARRAGDEDEANEILLERKEVQKDLIQHIKRNKLPMDINWWKRFNKSVMDKVRQTLRPDKPVRRDKKVDERRLRETFKIER